MQSMALPSLIIIPIVILVLVISPSIFAFQSISPLAVCGSRTKASSPHNQWQSPSIISITQQPNSRITQHRSSINMGIGSSSSSNINLSDTTKETYQNKSILITGASRGLGKSLAIALSKCNPSLLILSGRDEDALKQVKLECKTATTNESTMQVEIVTCDLANKLSVEQLANTAIQLSSGGSGGIDILINNGGISSRSSFLQTNIKVDEQLMQVNFFSGVMLAKKLIPTMVTNQNGGKVIWISSIQGKLGTPYRTSYAASKFAVQGYCEALRSELATSNVDVHVVSPGYIKTNLSLSAVMGDGKAYSKMDSTTANGADADEVACTILTSVANGKSDFVVAASFSAKIALWLRFAAPSFLESMLVKRFEKGQIESKKTE